MKIVLIFLLFSLSYSCIKGGNKQFKRALKVEVPKLVISNLPQNKSNVPKHKKFSLFRDTIIQKNIAHFIEYTDKGRLLQISTAASSYLIDSISSDKILAIDLAPRNGNQDLDLVISCVYDNVICNYVYRLLKEHTQFEKIHNHEKYPAIQPVDEKNDLYCTFEPHGCNWETWDSYLFKIEQLKIIELGRIAYDACAYFPESKEDSKFFVEVYKNEKLISKSTNYNDSLSTIIREGTGISGNLYWKNNIRYFTEYEKPKAFKHGTFFPIFTL